MARSAQQARRGAVRLLALGVATGTLVAAAPGAAVAAPAGSTTTHQLAAVGQGAGALRLTINLPVELPGIGSSITQTIALTNGEVTSFDPTTALSNAILGEGNTPVLSELLAGSSSASLDEPSDQPEPKLDISQPGLSLQLLPMGSQVADPRTTVDGLLARSSTGLASLALTGDLLPEALDAVTTPVTEAATDVLGTVTDGAEPAVGTVTGTLTGALTQLEEASGGASEPLTGPAAAAVEDATTALEQTLAELEELVANLGDATELVSLGAVTSEHEVTRAGTAVTSAVTSGVLDLSVLDGLVTVEAVKSVASATAGGTPGSSAATATPALLKVRVGDLLDVVLDETGLNVSGPLGQVLPAELQGVLDTASGALTDGLAELTGLQVTNGSGTTAAAPDGTSAEAAVSAARLVLNPVGLSDMLGGENFMELEFVPADTKVKALSSTITPVALPVDLPAELPSTGGSLPLAATAVALMVGAAVLLRRRGALG